MSDGTRTDWLLSTMTMLKDNHIWACGSIPNAVAAAKATGGFSVKIEVECQSLAEAHEAASAGADVVMLDNFTPKGVKEAAAAFKDKWGRDGKILVEISGGLKEANVADYVSQGKSRGCSGLADQTASSALTPRPDVDIISSSSIHQSAPHVDFSLKIVHGPPRQDQG